MPTYDYTCKRCKHHFERTVSIGERDKAKCPLCKRKAKRLLTAPGAVVFKGGGFYKSGG